MIVLPSVFRVNAEGIPTWLLREQREHPFAKCRNPPPNADTLGHDFKGLVIRNGCVAIDRGKCGSGENLAKRGHRKSRAGEDPETRIATLSRFTRTALEQQMASKLGRLRGQNLSQGACRHARSH